MEPVILYTTRVCWYCVQAKRLLKKRGIAFREIDVSDDLTVREKLVKVTGQRTVPQIFIGRQPIGGYTDLAGLDRSGELAGLIQSVEPVEDPSQLFPE